MLESDRTMVSTRPRVNVDEGEVKIDEKGLPKLLKTGRLGWPYGTT